MSRLIAFGLVIVSIHFDAVRAQIPGGHFADIKRVELADSPRWFELNATATDDGLELFFTRGITVFATQEIWVAKRSDPNDLFGEPELVDELNNPGKVDFVRQISGDGRTIYFSSDPDGTGIVSIYQATRATREEPFGEPVKLFDEGGGISLSPDGLTAYLDIAEVVGQNPTRFDIYFAERESVNDAFGPPIPLEIANTEFDEGSANISADGLILMWSDFILDSGDRPGGEGSADIWMSIRSSTDDPFVDVINVSELNTPNAESFVSSFDPRVSGSTIYFSTPREPVIPFTPGGGDWDLWQATWILDGRRGDFDGDGKLTVSDLDLIIAAQGGDGNSFDLTADGLVNFEDVSAWVKDVANTFFGDANLDGEFNSGDFVAVFQAGEYEDEIVGNSTWDTGDWNGDGEFDSSDFVTAFQDGGFEQGPRAAQHSVPEPDLAFSMLLAFGFVQGVRRKLQQRG